MSLCNTNWKNVLSGETHQPDVDFIVNDQDGEKVFPAHQYLLAIVSPVFKEQFYGENRENLKDDSGRIKICLDSSYSAVEAFFKYIFENCFGNLAFNDWFELLRLSQRFQIEKMSNDVKEAIVKFIIDNKVETVEAICSMKKVEKDLKDKVITMKDKVGQMAEEKKSLEHIGQQCKKELKEKNEKLENHLNIIRTSFELVEAKLKLDIDVLQTDRNMLTEENKKLKHDIEEKNNNNDMANLQKDQEILIEEKEVLVEENKTLKSQITDFALEKERISDLCDALMKENAEMKENVQQIAESANLKMQPGCITVKSEEVSVKSETYFEVKENNNQWSHSDGSRTLLSISTGEDFQELERRANTLELENKLLKETASLTRETFKRALTNSNARHMTMTDEKRLLEEEMEAMKMAYGAQIDFLKKEIESLKVRHSKVELDNNPAERSSKEFENKSNPSKRHAETSPEQAVIEISSKVIPNEENVIEELTDVTEIVARQKKESEQLKADIEDKNEQLRIKASPSKIHAETSQEQALIEISSKVIDNEENVINEELTDVAEIVARQKKESEQLKADIEGKNEQLRMLKDQINKVDGTLAYKEQELEELKAELKDNNEQFYMCKDKLDKISRELANVKKILANKKQELEKLKTDFDDKNEELKMIKNSVTMLKKVKKNLTLAETTIKSLNEDKKKLENEQLKSSTSICVSSLSKKPRLSFDSNDDGAESEDLRMSLDHRKIRRVLAKNAESGNPVVNKETAVNDDELDNFEYEFENNPQPVIIEIETGSEEADELEDVDRASERGLKHIEKTQSTRSQNLSPARHHTPQRSGPFRTHRSTPLPNDKNCRSRTRSPQNRGNYTSNSRNRKSSPRRLDSSSKKRPHSSERRRSSPYKRSPKVNRERKDLSNIRVTVQRKGIRSPPDNESSSDRAKTIQEKKSHDAREGRIPQVEDCGKGRVFQRLGGKARF